MAPLTASAHNFELAPTPLAHSSAVALQQPGEVVQAYALYVDGISFSRHDSVVGYWVHNLATHTRHLSAVLRTSEMCGCGCRGWCTAYCIWLAMSWSVVALCQGVWPRAREAGGGLAGPRRFLGHACWHCLRIVRSKVRSIFSLTSV